MTAVTAASSALLMVFVMSIPFGSTKLGVEVAGWYVPAPVTRLSLVNLAAATCACPLLPVRNFLAKHGLDSVGKSDP